MQICDFQTVTLPHTPRRKRRANNSTASIFSSYAERSENDAQSVIFYPIESAMNLGGFSPPLASNSDDGDDAA